MHMYIHLYLLVSFNFPPCYSYGGCVNCIQRSHNIEIVSERMRGVVTTWKSWTLSWMQGRERSCDMWLCGICLAVLQGTLGSQGGCTAVILLLFNSCEPGAITQLLLPRTWNLQRETESNTKDVRCSAQLTVSLGPLHLLLSPWPAASHSQLFTAAPGFLPCLCSNASALTTSSQLTSSSSVILCVTAQYYLSTWHISLPSILYFYCDCLLTFLLLKMYFL